MAHSVLIVDDIPYVRKFLTEIFTAAKFQVVGQAADGAQAVEQYSKLRPDLVTLDIVLPGVTGIDALRQIRVINKDAKVIVITALNQEMLIMESINEGAKDYVLKPFTPLDILKSVEKIFSHGTSPAPGKNAR